VDSDEGFDWHQDWESLQDVFTKYGIVPGKRVLMLGCGNCRLMGDMYMNGFTSIDCVDWSSEVIAKMKTKHSDKKGMSFHEVDITEGFEPKDTFRDNTYDVVLDKAVLDAIMCGQDSTDKVIAALVDIQRLLKPGGAFLSISHGDETSRKYFYKHFKLKDWDLKVEKIAKDSVSLKDQAPKFFHNCFICTK